MSQSIPEQLNVDRREFADAVNALTKICSSHLVGSGAGIFSSAIAYTFLYFKEQGLKRCQQTPFDIKERACSSTLRVNHFSSSLKAINPSLCIMSQSIPEQLNDSSATSVDLREGFPFQSVTVLSNEGSVHLILLARRYSTLESLDIGLSQHWSTLVDGLEII
ncbi:hypothetical protein Tco_0384960 [Tanacetum coccineum]